MRFFIDKTIAELDFTVDEHIHALENILGAGIEGNHLICAERSTLLRLSSIGSLGARFNSYCKHLLNNASFGGVDQHLKQVVVVDASIERPSKNGSSGYWHIPFKYFVISNLKLPTVLLAENLIDCQVLEHAANHYIIRNKLGGLSVSLQGRLGGGSTTYQALNQIITEEKETCICVLDSDKLSPNSGYGDTFNKCNSVMPRGGVWNSVLVATKSRELENELPPTFLYEALSNPDVASKLELLKKKVTLTDEAYWNFTDIKDGLSLAWILNLNKDTPEGKFWKVDNSFERVIDSKDCLDDCLDNRSCSMTADCRCKHIFPAIGANTLNLVLDWLNSQSHHKSLEHVDSDKHQAWLELGQNVLNFCVARKKFRL